MKLRKTNWFVRRYTYLKGSPPTNICDMFWTALFGGWGPIFFGIIFILLIVAGLIIMGRDFSNRLGLNYWIGIPLGIAAVLAIPTVLFGSLFGVYYLEQSGFFTWVKGKTCPILEIEDEQSSTV